MVSCDHDEQKGGAHTGRTTIGRTTAFARKYATKYQWNIKLSETTMPKFYKQDTVREISSSMKAKARDDHATITCIHSLIMGLWWFAWSFFAFVFVLHLVSYSTIPAFACMPHLISILFPQSYLYPLTLKMFYSCINFYYSCMLNYSDGRILVTPLCSSCHVDSAI